MSGNRIDELVHDLRSGRITRRSFIASAMALGASATAATAMVWRADGAFAQESPTPTPVVPVQHGSADAKVNIRYWTILSGPDGPYMNDLVDQFVAENPDIAVESLQGLTDFIPKMQAAAISDTAPDVALIRSHYIAPFASKSILSPIEQAELDQSGIKAEDYDPTVWTFTSYEGSQYTVPLDIHSMALMYDNALLTAGGFGVPTTLDELYAIAQALTKDDIVGYMHWILNNGDVADPFTWLWYTYQRQFGGQMLSEDGTKAAFNTAEGVAALSWMKQMEDAGNPQHLPYFDLNRSGKVATWPDGPWILNAMFDPESAPAAADLGVSPMPQHDAANPAVWAQSHQFSLPKQSNQDADRRAASLTFVNWITARASDWAKAGQIPARNSARDELLASTDERLMKLHAWADQLPYAKFMPSVPTLLEALPRIGSHVQAALLGQAAVEDALKDAESEVNDILSGE